MKTLSQLLSTCICLVAFFSCQPLQDEAVHSENPRFSVAQGCYRQILNRDTAFLNLNIVDTTVSGSLEYRRFEKDRNSGTIKGVIHDSLIVANYKFQSEGVNSVREIVFLIKEGTLVEGYGDITMTGDTARFTDLASLQFMAGPFVKDSCASQ